jgi:hypothetical protein
MRRSMLLLVLALPFFLACAGAPPKAANPPPPPPLQPIEDVQLRSSMWRMAQHTGALRDLLLTAQEPGENERREALRLLGEIEATVKELAESPPTAQHPVLAEDLPGFRDDVERARRSAEGEPPDYQPAVDLASSCKRCHVVAQVPARLPWRVASRE